MPDWNTPATGKGNTHAVGGGGGRIILMLVSMSCMRSWITSMGSSSSCTLGNHTVRLIAATGKKSIDETTGDLDGTYVHMGRISRNWVYAGTP